MNNTITVMDAVSITIPSMTIVFLALILIALVLASFKLIFKERHKTEVKNNTSSTTVVNSDEEERLVACLVASAMAGDGKINPNLHIKRVTRIK